MKQGLIWSAIARYSQLVIGLLLTMLLARMLTPNDFGVIAAVLVVNNFVYALIDAGIPSAVIQKKELKKIDLNSFFTFSFIVSILAFFLIYVFSDSIARLMNIQELESIFKVLGINFIFLGMLGVPLGLLQRNLKFKLIAISELISVMIGGLIALYLALNDYSYWSLVFQMLTYMASKLIFCFIFSKYKPFLQISIVSIKYLIRYSGFLTLFTSINYWSRNFDNLLVGRVFGSETLGLYSQAYRVLLLPTQLISYVLNAIIHPYFAIEHNKNNKQVLPQLYSKIFVSSLILASPISAMMLFMPLDLLNVLWGEQWNEASDFVTLFSILALIQPALATTGDVYKSTNNNRILFIIGLINTLAVIAGMYIGSNFGIKGLIYGYIISYSFIVAPVTIYGVFKLAFNSKLSGLLKQIIFQLPFILLVFSSVGWVSTIISSDLHLLRLIVSGFISLIILMVWWKMTFKNIKKI